MKRQMMGLLFVLLCSGVARAQQATLVPRCAGSNDTEELATIISRIGSNKGTIRLPAESGSRCAVNNLKIPTNVTLDNTAGAGIKINTGQTLIDDGPIVNPAGKQIFYNGLSGQGTVSFAGNSSLPQVMPQWWGAKGDGTSDSAPAINAALDAASAVAIEVHVPAGTYRLVPATSTADAGGTMLTALVMRSGMHIVADGTVMFKIADNISTSRSPVRMAMFHTNTALTNVSIVGLICDMNGANNRINPDGGPWDNGRNQACVSVSGDRARVDKMVLENNTFQNTAGTNFVVAGQSNRPGVTLGSGWLLRKNLFKNGGTNVTDFSAVSAWTDNVLADENTFTNDNPPVTGNGLITAFEVHGSNHRFVNNRVNNARRGVYVAANFTSAVKNTLIENNTFTNIVDYGVDFYRQVAADTAIDTVVISKNSIALTDQQNTSQKAFVNLNVKYAVTNVLVADNVGSKVGTKVNSSFVVVSADTGSGSKSDQIMISRNRAKGFVTGVAIVSDAAVGVGRVTVQDNEFNDLATAGGSTAMGVVVNVRAGALDSVSVTGNQFNIAVYGVFLIGRITAVNVFGNSYQNIATSDFDESRANITTKTTRAGP
ncbi:MAG TPA: hypothetical protein DC054_09965 [Blastocatellia bacterium]|nr:hypothetical protein [Blastocatellia bacterium]